MKVFKFEKRIPAIMVEFYEVTAETEDEALDMVMDGKGFQESFTDTADDEVELELYDTEDPADWDENGFPKTDPREIAMPYEYEPEFGSDGFSIADRDPQDPAAGIIPEK